MYGRLIGEKNKEAEQRKVSRLGQASASQIADATERKNAARNLREDYEDIKEQSDKAREPAYIEAEAVKEIADAMHRPNRMEALLHSHIPEKIISNMGELEAIERDAIALWKGQLEDFQRMLDETEEFPDAVSEEDMERMKELIIENELHLRGILQAVDDAFELTLSAGDKGRAEHAVKNIASIVQGARGQTDFELEGARSLWRKLKDRFNSPGGN
jgi:hypothetical protein